MSVVKNIEVVNFCKIKVQLLIFSYFLDPRPVRLNRLLSVQKFPVGLLCDKDFYSITAFEIYRHLTHFSEKDKPEQPQ